VATALPYAPCPSRWPSWMSSMLTSLTTQEGH
jgi:hypothetical protein